MKGFSSLFLRISISLIITLALGWVFFSIEEPYTLEVVEKRPWEPSKNTTYSDLNSDGKTERILLSNSASGQVGLIVYNHDDRIINQYNILGKYVKRSEIYSGDYDQDKNSELYVFTYIGDSLFLNIVDVFNQEKPNLGRKHIPGCTSLHGEAQYIITAPVFEDANDDGKLEFYFAISAGFTLQPRALYYYDIVNNRIEHSGLSGVAPRYILDAYDLDGDGKKEIWGRSNAVGNYKTTMAYTDSSAWLMIYNHKLDYLFEPYEFYGFTSVLNTCILQSEIDTMLVATRTLEAANDSIFNEIALFSLSGDLISRKALKDYGLERGLFCYTDKQYICLIDYEGRAVVLDQELKPHRSFQREGLCGTKYGPLELQGSGLNIFICQGIEGEIRIYSSRLKMLASMAIDDNSARNDFMPVFISRSKINSGFHLRTYSHDYAFSLEKNKSRYYVFLYAFSLFISFYLIIYFIQHQQQKQEEAKKAMEAKMRALQAQAAKSQMSPHFIFNALNSISAMYIKGDTARADAFLTSFSRMIREVVDSSDRLVVSIDEEIDFVKNYLELEKVRHEDRLSYSINIPADCANKELPSMCIHTFVENSIKHAFVGKRSVHLNISAKCDSANTMVIIEDNGPGYNKGNEKTARKGRGLDIISDIFESYRMIKGKMIEYKIKDLEESEGGDSRGTQVIINIKA